MTGYVGAPWYNNIYFGEDDHPQDAVNAVVAFWTPIAAIMYNGITIRVDPAGVVIDEATGLPTGIQVADTPDPIQGSADGEMLPMQVQGLVRLQTSLYVAGRRVQGKVFVPGITEGNAVAGFPSTAARSAMQAGADQLNGDPLDTNVAGVYSKKNRVWTPITATSTWDYFATLKSRRD